MPGLIEAIARQVTRLTTPADLELLPLDLDRDAPEIEALLAAEEWPFLRSDLAVSHAQPGGRSFVARKGGDLVAFFTTHAFGAVGYLDMMVVDAAHRGTGVARPLYLRTLEALEEAGIESLVVHTTNDSAPMIRLLGFRPGDSFTLLARDGAPPVADPILPAGMRVEESGTVDPAAWIDLDAAVFGAPRPDWVGALFAEPSTHGLALRGPAGLRASLWLRPRRGGALCLDQVLAPEESDLDALLDAVFHRHPDRRLECFVRDGGPLDVRLRARGFAVPDFFGPIGPLVEWRRGETGDLGTSPAVRCLSWL